MKISLSKAYMEKAFLDYLKEILDHPEVKYAKVRDILIDRDHRTDAGRQAFEAGYHDCYSDVDLAVKVSLPEDRSVTPEEYIRRIDRFGVSADTALGWTLIPGSTMYRIVFRNGMRYDFGFEFEYDGSSALIFEKQKESEKENTDWPLDNINRFWFVQIQALGKLYRKDYLISSHLANMNCNDTLVMQMVLRDLKYGTNHHRYGYSEEPEYVRDLGKAPYQRNDPTFHRIAEHLYAAALAHDRLAKRFYPGYQERYHDFLAIWDCYDASDPKAAAEQPV